MTAASGVALALWAQMRLDVAPDKWFDPALLFILAIVCWSVALSADRGSLASPPPPTVPGPAFTRRRVQFLAGAGAIVLFCGMVWPAVVGPVGLGFLEYPDGPSSGVNHLTWFGLAMWAAAAILYVAAVADVQHLRVQRPAWMDADGIRLSIPFEILAVLGVMAVAAWFRFVDLGGGPLEMTSDHTEKLSDVARLLGGLHPIFFEGNAGREPLQFYWTALLIRLGLPNAFLTLKEGMAAVSVLTIPFVYLLGRRVAGPLAGLLAAMVLAMAPWHIQITRIGLRIAWSPIFVAVVLVLLFRALESGRRNDWVVAGLASGLGVYGYTGFRPMALVIPAVVVLRILYGWRAGGMTRSAWAAYGAHAIAAAGAALVVLVPLLRYAVDRPESFWFRTFTRMSDREVAIPGPLAQVFVSNWRNALLMFNRTSDGAWFQSPAGRPALETVGGALVVLGAVTALHRARRGDWKSAALLVAVPLLLASSALSLAFPHENPSLSRAAGAVIPVVILVGLSLDVLGRHLGEYRRPWGPTLLLVALVGLFVAMGRNTVQRYFVEYRALYDQSTHPTIELAKVLTTFMSLGGDLDHAYFVGWQHGPDYRAIGQLAGDLNWSGLLWGADDGSDAVFLADPHVADPTRKLYLVGGPLASSNIAHLEELFPGAVVTAHRTKNESKNFWSVFVPGEAVP